MYCLYRHAKWEWTEWCSSNSRMGQEVEGEYFLCSRPKEILMNSTGTVEGRIPSCRLTFPKGRMRWIRQINYWWLVRRIGRYMSSISTHLVRYTGYVAVTPGVCNSADDQTIDSPLKWQTRSIACFPSGDAYAVGSIEGRVAIQ